MPETTPLIKAALNLRGGAGFDVYFLNCVWYCPQIIKFSFHAEIKNAKRMPLLHRLSFDTAYNLKQRMPHYRRLTHFGSGFLWIIKGKSSLSRSLITGYA